MEERFNGDYEVIYDDAVLTVNGETHIVTSPVVELRRIDD